MKKIFCILFLVFTSLTGVFSQRVGINTDMPQETLDVRGNVYLSNQLGIGIFNPQFPLSFSPTLGDKISLWGNSGPHYGLGIQSYLLQIHTDGSASDIAFGHGSSYSFTENMRIKGNGYVGIGIVSPSQKLHVGAGGVRLEGTTPGGTALSLGGNGDVQVDAPGIVAGRFVIKDNGDVGIGINTPSQKLHVVGNICATGTIGACSDIRYKQNISPIAHSLSSVLSLHGLYYHWKKNEFPQMEFGDERQIGFSAQEVEKLFPEVVMTDADGNKSLDYGRLTPVLVEAIKEQQKQINTQQKQIDELKKDQLQLQEQMAELKKMMEKTLK